MRDVLRQHLAPAVDGEQPALEADGRLHAHTVSVTVTAAMQWSGCNDLPHTHAHALTANGLGGPGCSAAAYLPPP